MAILILGCGKTDPGKLQNEIEDLRKAKAKAGAEKAALEKEIAAYRADLEHERFLNQELKKKFKESKDIQQIADLAKMLPQIQADAKQKAASARHEPAPVPAAPTSPVSEAIAVASAVPSAKPLEPLKLAEPAAKPSRAEAPPRRAAQQVKTEEAAAAAEGKAPQKEEGAKGRELPGQVEPKKKEASPAIAPKREVAAKATAASPEPSLPRKPAPETKSHDEAKKPETKPLPRAASDSGGESELQLLSLVNRKHGEKLLLSGEVRNNTELPAKEVIVTARLYDERNALIKEIRIPVLNGSSLPGGEKAAFRMEVPWDNRTSRCIFEVEGTQKVNVSRRN